MFKTIDADESGDLTGEEVNAWFKKEQGMDMPAELMEKEDKDGDVSTIALAVTNGCATQTPPRTPAFSIASLHYFLVTFL